MSGTTRRVIVKGRSAACGSLDPARRPVLCGCQALRAAPAPPTIRNASTRPRRRHESHYGFVMVANLVVESDAPREFATNFIRG